MFLSHSNLGFALISSHGSIRKFLVLNKIQSVRRDRYQAREANI